MSEERSWAAEMDAAWWGFEQRLGVRLAELADGETVLLEQMLGELDDEEGCAPYAQFLGSPEGVLGELSGNRWLTPAHRLDEAGSDVLAVTGWNPPADESDAEQANHWFAVESGDVEDAARLAGMTVQALRAAYGVLHPTFLLTSGLDAEQGPTGEEIRGAALVIAYPATYDALVEHVDQALWPYLGHEPAKDSDGDVPLQSGESVVFVRTLPEPLGVEVMSMVVLGVADRARALEEINILNRDRHGVTFTLAVDSVVARRHLSAQPFVAAHLRETLDALNDVDEVAGDLVMRCGGRKFLADHLAEGAAPVPRPALSNRSRMPTLVHLEADEPGSVTPQLAAHVFGHDQRAILEQIGRLRRDGRTELVPLLRAALRVVVEADAAKSGSAR